MNEQKSWEAAIRLAQAEAAAAAEEAQRTAQEKAEAEFKERGALLTRILNEIYGFGLTEPLETPVFDAGDGLTIKLQGAGTSLDYNPPMIESYTTCNRYTYSLLIAINRDEEDIDPERGPMLALSRIECLRDFIRDPAAARAQLANAIDDVRREAADKLVAEARAEANRAAKAEEEAPYYLALSFSGWYQLQNAMNKAYAEGYRYMGISPETDETFGTVIMYRSRG